MDDGGPAFPVYSVGPDDFSTWDWSEIHDPYIWMVYSYERFSYDGAGIAVGLRPDDLLDWGSLAHNSCYGPAANWPATTVSAREMLNLLERDDSVPGGRDRSSKDYDYDHWAAIAPKIRELLAEREKEKA